MDLSDTNSTPPGNSDTEAGGPHYRPAVPRNQYYPLSPTPIPPGRMSYEQVVELAKRNNW